MVRCEAALGETEKDADKPSRDMETLLPKMPAAVRNQCAQWLTVVRKPVAAGE